MDFSTRQQVELILSSPASQRAEHATLVLELETLLKTQDSDPSGRDIMYILSLANTLEDKDFMRLFPGLAPTFYSSRSELLKEVASHSTMNFAKLLIENHFAEVAQNEFDWLHDVKDMGCSTEQMLASIIDLQETGHCISIDDPNPEGDDPGELDSELHQDHCIHEGGPVIDQHRTFATLQPIIDSANRVSHRNETLRVISAYCGLAGVIPDWRSEKILVGRATCEFYREGYASIWFSDTLEHIKFEEAKEQGETGPESSRGSSGKLGKQSRQEDPYDKEFTSDQKKATSRGQVHDATEGLQFPIRTSKSPSTYNRPFDSPRSTTRENKSSSGTGPQTQSLSSAQARQIQSDQRYTLDEGYPLRVSEIKTIELLKQATTRLCSAARVLQRNQFCCNAFTVIVSRESSDLLGHGLDLVSILFTTLKALRDSVSALSIETTGRLPMVLRDAVNKCSAISLKLLRIFAPQSKVESAHRDSFPLQGVESHLHICSLVTQFLGLGLVCYAQGHLGPYCPFFLQHPLSEIMLYGTTDDGLHIKACLRELTCLGKLVGGRVFTFGLLPALSRPPGVVLPAVALDLCGRGIDIADTWGPGLLISRPGTTYGQQVYAIEIGGGVIRSVESQGIRVDLNKPLYHWSPRYGSYSEMRTQPTFSCWDGIRIGAIEARQHCPLDPEKYRKRSEQILSNLGTVADSWELGERQVALQAGYYTVLQLGNTFVRKLGITVKQQIIEQWSSMPNIHTLDVPWGLQVSLCTGVARRVSLRALIGDLLFTHIKSLQLDQWQNMLPKAKEAFWGLHDLSKWYEGLNANEKSCLIAIIHYVLGLLKGTGVDRGSRRMSVLWPHGTNGSYGIKLKCDGKNSWTRILHDSESCATFAAVTSQCIECPSHKCRNMKAPSWQGVGGFLSTAVCRDLTAGTSMAATFCRLRLTDGQRYWVGKIDSDYWLVVRKTQDSDVGLYVKRNRIPKAVAQKILRLDVIRERPEVDFDAEDVLVWGDEDS